MKNDFELGFLTAMQFAWWGFLRSPGNGYRKVKAWRDKILSTIEMLQTESARWKALFTTLKLPYLALTKAGVSPNMAVSLLIGGTAVGGGAIVAEVMEPPSFSRGDSGVYQAPQDSPVEWSESMQTLRVDL